MSSTIERATLTAPDISSGHCIATINTLVGAIDGVRRVEASEQTKQVRVEYNSAQVSPAKSEAVLDEGGYPAAK